MALFRRTKSTEIPELQEYYQSQKRDNPVLAWLLAAMSLLITIAVVLGLFFGGRWLYRTLFDDNNNATTQTEQPTETPDVIGEGNENIDESQPEPEDEPASTDENNDETDRGDVEVSTPDTTPSTGALPNTGPSEPEL